jgi:sugar lactone lactonase YvrE
VRAQTPPAPALGTPASVITTPPRDFGPNGAPTVYGRDPDIITIDPAFDALTQGNTPIKRLWTGALWSEDRPGVPSAAFDVHVFDVGADNKPANGKLFSDFMIDGIKCGPDGIRADVNGNLWISSNAGRNLGYSGVTVWSPDAKLLGRIRLPESCANVCFGGRKRNRLFMAASQSLYALYVAVQGAGPA